MKLRLYSVALTAALAVVSPNAARAQDSSAAAEALFNDARAALAEKQFDVACEKFRESDRLDPAVGTRFNLANCEEQRGRLATAWALFRQVLEQLPPDDGRTAVAKDRAAALEYRVPRLILRARHELPEGTTAQVAGLVLQRASFGSPVPLDPGTYAVIVTTPGDRAQQFTVTLREGDTAELGVPAEARAVPAPSAAKAHTAIAQGSEHPRPRSHAPTLAYVLGGFGAAGLVAGSVFGLVGLHEQSLGNGNCNDRTRTCSQTGYDANRRARSFATVSTVGFVVGVLGIGVGSYLWLTMPDTSVAAVGVGNLAGGPAVAWRTQW
jgi:hypothetical protein